MKRSGKHIAPPAWVRRFFEWYCGDSVAEDLVGDMDELFYQDLKTKSSFKARINYTWQAITLLFSASVRIRKNNHLAVHGSETYHSVAIYKSYAKIAFRNLAKQKTFSLINMICLSVGMSVGLLALAAWVDVREVDSFQTNADQLYRVTTKYEDVSDKYHFASSSAPLAERLKEDATGIDNVVQIRRDFNPEIVQSANTSLPLLGYYTTNEFFKAFTYPLEQGTVQSALQKPFTIVLTHSAAEKLFRNDNVIGKIVEVKGLGNFEVTGVVKDPPRSHFLFEVLASYSTLALLEQQGKLEPTLNDWGPVTPYYTYLKIGQGKSVTEVTSLIESISRPRYEENKKLTAHVTHTLQPFTDIPMSDLNAEIGLSWGTAALLIFFFLSLLILLPACFNYANIAIARALKRAKEIGLRKVSGGQSRHVFFQMVMETVILSVISLGFAILIFMSIRDGLLNMIVQGHRSFDLKITPSTFLIFLLYGILTGIFAGFFPAAYFSRLNPIETLRNASQTGKLSKISIRKGLVVAQFTISLFFILGVSIIFQQYRYALNYDMGFQKENILDVRLTQVNPVVFKTEFEKLPDVVAVSMASDIPGNWESGGTWIKTAPGSDSVEVDQMFIDPSYIANLGIGMVAGRNFPTAASTSEEYIIVNETFLKKTKSGTAQDALDKTLLVDGKDLRILGVVKDFNYLPLREEIRSFFFRYDPGRLAYANVKLRSSDIQKTLADMELVWNKISPDKFESRFLDDELQYSVVSFLSMIKIFGFLGAMAITISCLGLLAVVISSAEGRMKEMGIRKIMGASIPALALSLSKGFLKLIGIAILIATPATYLIFDTTFIRINYYHASIGIAELAFGISLLLVLVAIIIGSQTIKVARVNPVDTLRAE